VLDVALKDRGVMTTDRIVRLVGGGWDEDACVRLGVDLTVKAWLVSYMEKQRGIEVAFDLSQLVERNQNYNELLTQQGLAMLAGAKQAAGKGKKKIFTDTFDHRTSNHCSLVLHRCI
jgi:hypothetical protein